jgi:hypothetical protein
MVARDQAVVPQFALAQAESMLAQALVKAGVPLAATVSLVALFSTTH